jgi:hypothetical protein
VQAEEGDLISEGFPEHKVQLDNDLRKYWSVRDKLSVVNDLILYGQMHVLVPTAMRREVLEELHAAHLGREKMFMRAKQSIFWPHISRDIEELVRSCKQCEVHKASQVKEPLLPDVRLSQPSKAIAGDILSFAGRKYLVIMISTLAGLISLTVVKMVLILIVFASTSWTGSHTWVCQLD